MRQFEQPIRFSAHRGKHHYDLVPALLRLCDPVGDPVNPFDRSDRSPAIFLNNERHGRQLLEKNLLTNLVASRAGVAAAPASISVKRDPVFPASFPPPSPNA